MVRTPPSKRDCLQGGMADRQPFIIPPQEPLTRIGRCMYCGKAPPEVKLTDEHPIPYSFGGHRYLPDAACTECIKKTHAFIGSCSGTMLEALRLHHSLPSRSVRKRRPRKETITLTVGLGDEAVIKETHKDEAPGIVTFPRFLPPGILLARDLSAEIQTEYPPFFTFTTPDFEERAARVRGSGHDPGIEWRGGSPFAFAQVLAHVGYGYLVANQGIPDESPLPAIIMGDDPCLSHWIGGTPDSAVIVPPPTQNETLHQVYGIYYLIDGVEYFVAQIRLFAYLSPTPPVYSVISCRRQIPKRNTYFAFTSDKAADRVFIEGPISRI